MISLRNYLKMDRSALRELLLRSVLPYHVNGQISIHELPHHRYSLNDHPELFDPSNNLPFQRGSIEGFIVNDAICWPSAGVIRVPGGQSIAESYFDPRDIAVARKQKHLVRFPRQEAEIATSIGHIYRNYFHKHIDSIPRLYSLHHPDLLALPRISLYLDPRFSREELEIIELLIPNNVEIRQVDFTTRVHARRQVFLPFLSHERTGWSEFFKNCAGYLPDEYIRFYRRQIHTRWGLPSESSGKRIFISRRDASIRRLTNEEEVMQLLGPLGFERYSLEGMSIREQAHLFAGSDIIVAQHGASLTNLLYGQPGTRVVEIFSGKKLKIYETLVNAMRMKYFPITTGTAQKNADVEVPLEKLESIIEEALSKPKTK